MAIMSTTPKSTEAAAAAADGATATSWASALASDAQKLRVCAACAQSLPLPAFSRTQLTKPSAKCKACVGQALAEVQEALDAQARIKRCVQCFQDLPKTAFSKRQAHLLDGKCISCVRELERAAAAAPVLVASKWTFDRYYRVCHRGKGGGVAVRVKANIASPVLGHIPLGRVFRATAPICNEQGDPMVRLEGPHLPSVVVRNQDKATDVDEEEKGETKRLIKEAWVSCRSIRNEILLEPHPGPFWADLFSFREDDEVDSSSSSRFFRCVVEGCKARASANLSLSELGYVLYGDVVEVMQACVAPDGLIFLRLHDRYFDGEAWVVERSLDNESVLNPVEGPWGLFTIQPEIYRCVQDSGAPVRREPELTAPPVGRIPCGSRVRVLERIVTAQRQVFLRILEDGEVVGSTDLDVESKWVIETSTCCASVMIKLAVEAVEQNL